MIGTIIYLLGVIFTIIYGVIFLMKHKKEYVNFNNKTKLIGYIILSSLFSWLGAIILYEVTKKSKNKNDVL